MATLSLSFTLALDTINKAVIAIAIPLCTITTMRTATIVGNTSATTVAHHTPNLLSQSKHTKLSLGLTSTRRNSAHCLVRTISEALRTHYHYHQWKGYCTHTHSAL